VTGHHFDGDLGVPIIEFDQKLALVSSRPLDLRVLPSAPGALTVNERSSLATEAQRLWASAIKSRLLDESVDNRFELEEPQVLGVPGAPGLRTVLFPTSDEVAKFEPLFFFRIGAEPRTYLLTNYSGPWESWGLVAIIDPTRAQVVSN
jgi:hypothetical protein